MAGRHAQLPAGTPLRERRSVLVAGVIGLVLLVGGGLAWAMTGRTPVRATTTAAETSATAEAIPPVPTSTPADPDTPPAALIACVGSIDAGSPVVAAAASAHDHWGRHVQAQNDYTAERINREQVLAVWAETKAPGPADLAAFDAARAQFEPVSAACSNLQPAELPANWQTAATNCTSRASALATAVRASEAMETDWRHHIEMMQNKPHTDPTQYGQMWLDMVNAAPPNLNAYAAARDALDQQPPCALKP